MTTDQKNESKLKALDKIMTQATSMGWRVSDDAVACDVCGGPMLSYVSVDCEILGYSAICGKCYGFWGRARDDASAKAEGRK